MTFPTVQSVTSTSFSTATTAHAANMPATVNSSDLLLAIVSTDGNNGPASPTGWTFRWSNASPGNATVLAAWTRRADGTEGGTTVDFATVSACTAAIQIWRVTGCATQGFSGNGTGTSTTPDPGSNALGSASRDCLWIAVMGIDNDSAGTITSYPANYTLNQTETNSVGGSATNPTLGCAARQLATGTEDPGTFTCASGAWSAFTIVLLPGKSSPPYQPTTPRVWRLS